jgi:hypothetical protein
MGDNTEFDLNDLPEEVLNEIANGEVFTIEEEVQATTEDSSIVEEPAVEAPVKQTDNEIIDELVVAVEKKVTKKASTKKEPGMYHNGRLIQAVPSRLGKKWVVLIDGKREKVLRSEIEIVE